MHARYVCAAVLVGTLFLAPPEALADSKGTPAPAASPSAESERPRDGGIITGKIASVDYQRNIIIVSRTPITVMPSTQIQGSDPGYHAFTDLKPGMSVEVYTSQVAGKYIAQIITLR